MNTQSILVIDDDQDIGDLIATTAGGIGLTCTLTTDAEGFFKALTPEITLILLDLVMPATDGIEILRHLGEQRCPTGIVLMSGIGKRVMETAETLAAALGLVIVGHLMKPFSITQLEEMLTRDHKPNTLRRAAQSRDLLFQVGEFQKAIQEDEFVLHYQPQIEIATGRCLGVEALVRWQHPTLGLIFPDSFITCAEDLKLIDSLTWLVIRRGMSEMGAVTDRDGEPLMLSFNVSVLSLHDLTFPENFMAIATEFGVPPENVILEITESGLIRELSHTLDVLTRLRMKKVRLSIDDFGTGYSMMEQLQLIPANELKIDKSLLHGMKTDQHRVMVHKMIELSSELDMISVAEGVETREQLEFLRQKGCDIAQGYLFSKPLPKSSFLEWFEEYQKTRKSSPSGRFI